MRAIAAAPGAARFYAAAGPGLLRSDDGGRGWSTTGRAPAGVAALAVVPEDAGDVLYAATLDEGVLASQDDGRSWAPASGFVTGALPTMRVTGIVYDGRSGDVGQSPGRSFRGALFAATDRGLFRSTDGGGAWARLPLEADLAALTLGADDPRVVLAVDRDGRVYRSADRGVTWDGRG